MNASNFILAADSYKFSQYPQYPEGTDYVYSYIESRGGKYPEVMFAGLQPWLRSLPIITMSMIEEAEEIVLAHGLPFNRAGWEYIVRARAGRLPLLIKAVPEGTVVPVSNVLLTVENTDWRCAWLTSFIETSLLRAIWYMTTVATNSYESRKVIMKALVKSGNPDLIDFKLHDFGARGVSSEESATLGGMAHLFNFMGTDTVSAVLGARRYYDSKMAGFSIPAMEHSTVTSWGRDHEVDSYENMLHLYAKPGAIVAMVMDSYDLFEAIKALGTTLKDQVIKSGATVVVRPDSGDPVKIVPQALMSLNDLFGSTFNNKDYRVLNNVRVIQGDGITHETIHEILRVSMLSGFSADNIAFGQGGALLQQVNRDTCEFAMKCSAAQVNGEWRAVYKDPITGSSKRSKRGRMSLIRDRAGYHTVGEQGPSVDLLKVRYNNGERIGDESLDTIRERVRMQAGGR